MLEDALWLNQVLLVSVGETDNAAVVVVLPAGDLDDHDEDRDDDHDGKDDDLACLMCFSCTSYSGSSSKLHRRAK